MKTDGGMQQFKLIQTLDGLRGQAAHINQRKMVTRKLTTMALPKVWELSNGQLMHVVTPATTRAADLGQVDWTFLRALETSLAVHHSVV